MANFPNVPNDDESDIIQEIQIFMDNINNSANHVLSQIHYIQKMYIYLMSVPIFLRKYPQFLEATIKKKDELRNAPISDRIKKTFDRYTRFTDKL